MAMAKRAFPFMQATGEWNRTAVRRTFLEHAKTETQHGRSEQFCFLFSFGCCHSLNSVRNYSDWIYMKRKWNLVADEKLRTRKSITRFRSYVVLLRHIRAATFFRKMLSSLSNVYFAPARNPVETNERTCCEQRMRISSGATRPKSVHYSHGSIPGREFSLNTSPSVLQAASAFVATINIQFTWLEEDFAACTGTHTPAHRPAS